MNSRRHFLHQGALCLAGFSVGSSLAADPEAAPLVRVGLVTDLHYADKEPTKTRFYRETLGKFDEALAFFTRAKPDHVIELGDIIDQADTVEQEIAWLQTMETRYARLQMPRHYVLGNHCVTTLTKAEFATHTGAAATGYSSFEQKGIRFILLDACFREDGTPYGRQNFHWKDTAIPSQEMEWLKGELSQASGHVIVMTHQRLDLDAAHAVKNAAEIRAILEASRKVLAVFQGHSHKNDLQTIAGIPYCTLAAMIEGTGLANSGYSLLNVMPDSSLRLAGHRQQTPRDFRATPSA